MFQPSNQIISSQPGMEELTNFFFVGHSPFFGLDDNIFGWSKT